MTPGVDSTQERGRLVVRLLHIPTQTQPGASLATLDGTKESSLDPATFRIPHRAVLIVCPGPCAIRGTGESFSSSGFKAELSVREIHILILKAIILCTFLFLSLEKRRSLPEYL